MSLLEISQCLDSLSAKELAELEHLVHVARAQKGDTTLYDDSYGKWSEDDQIATATFLAEAERHDS